MTKHQTAVPVTFDGHTVRMNDPDLFVFAWGNGKCRRRQYLEENGTVFQPGQRFTQTDLRDFFHNVANPQQRNYIRQQGWL